MAEGFEVVGLSVEDRLDILELYSHFAKRLDDGDLTGILSLFTENATFIGPWGSVTGREQIAQAVASMIQQARGTHHLVYSPTIIKEAGITKGHANFLQISLDSGDMMAGRGSFSDRFSNSVGGHWRFLSRELLLPDALYIDQDDEIAAPVTLAAAADGPLAQFLATSHASPPPPG